jgi:P27 family predicted phage terminase small subunit
MTPKPPKTLSAPGKRLWRAIAQEIDLDAAGCLMLSVLVEAWQRREEARAAIAKTGACLPDRWGQLKPSPWLSVERDTTLAIQRSFRALGLDLEQEK